MEPIQVLVIDPEENTRNQLRTAFEKDERIELHLSSSAEGAKEVLMGRTSWGLVVLNVWLPGQDAFSFVQEWRQRDSKTQFILLSQDASKLELVKALRLGVSDYFEKPLQISDLMSAVDAVVQRLKGLAPVVPLSRNATSSVSLPSQLPEMTSNKVSTPALRSELSQSAVPIGGRLRLVSSDASPVQGSEFGPGTGERGSALAPSYTDLKRKWVETFEVDYLSQLLNQHGGNVSAAAREARLDRSNFLRLLRKYGLRADVYRGKMAA
jgi:DNA-binding NtrC family response regulator